MSRVTIVVPVYNVEQYIAKCLDSLLQQDYDDYSIMVVNDGSPANEQVIIDEYAKKSDKIIPLIKENGGYGSALQLAFSKIDSEFVLVCDPDDWLSEDALSTLVSLADKHHADAVFGSKYLVYADNSEKNYTKSYNDFYGVIPSETKIERGTKLFDNLFFIDPSPHSKLYKTEMVKKHIFPTKVSYTDNLLFFLTLSMCNSAVYTEKPLAYYLINRPGNSSTDLKPTVIDQMVKVFTTIIDNVSNPLDIFYFRMFESYKSIYYEVDRINADRAGCKEKYELVYSLLEKLSAHSKAINQYRKQYKTGTIMTRYQESQLLSSNSKKMFDKLVEKRLNKRFEE